MTITLELKPDIEERVRAQAQGVSPETYLTGVIESQMLVVEPHPATLAEFAAALEAVADDSDDLPVLPPEALTREAIYGDPP